MNADNLTITPFFKRFCSENIFHFLDE